MSLSNYLASKYLTAEPSKKRKRKDKSSTSQPGLIIADDDALGWTTTLTPDEEAKPLTITSTSAEFRKSKTNAWKPVGEAAAAEQILADTARENAAALQEEEPVVEDDGVVKMGDGTHAGLQSAADVSRQFEKRKRAERERWEKEQRGGKKGGRRLRQEARREADEAAKKEREAAEAQKGDYQRALKEKRKEELDEARFLGVARGVDDVEMNEELRGVERWNDPAAQFLVKKKEGKSVTGRPLYKGAAQPNRYGIRPGHKWDGVDRGNGWEGERFKALNRKTRNKELDFAWQMDT
ncbi:hypothetical protein GLAREA_08015 [Glarea lozoyensis ATCC 20868]|uniref:Pre-mRNA-splicing factor cwc26 n=1 Tax=Glarea lozoyensis (strain ATCC 20868 / MF5171) TaxID=1116229 RepID=S3CDS3_GLAL2|nr:uncharacterized protein GLAREA_08015 [Glarea lozoyensis ATCC 20868]EPE24165.1 hypothetical protein GLAREA_08015 [Glarea lozoyensis ATCC 20868]